MELARLLDKLGYAESENYLREDRGDFNHIVDYGHIFRKAAEDRCRLRGVYTLKETQNVSIPLVYVCEALSEDDAKNIHKLVWNQDTVPFLVINSPETVRVYPGFCLERTSGRNRAAEDVLQAFGAADLEKIVQTLQASAVDSGQTWKAWGQYIRPEHRVDRRLLHNLKELDTWLQEKGRLDRSVSHALIGKYVFLHYLRDRDILSADKIEEWDIPQDAVFSRNATADGLQSLLGELDKWLNGEVFPLDWDALRDRHIARVAATFQGDRPDGADQWQLHLDFKAYNFSYIPIEVLSIVYEQFLYAPERQGSPSRGRSAGAYYTPIPVVNFMLSEMEERHPLRRGMRVGDFACGSGAFLVQAFRRLIEKEFSPSGRQPSPIELRELLKDHFFGLDTDPDACSVAELSLILTLLDYVHPPDLKTKRPGPDPKLPKLRGENIFCGNFFDDNADWQRVLARKKCDWIVGNPPWKQLTSENMRKEDEPVLDWIKAEEKSRPVGNRQAARAFAWRVADYVSDGGEIAMFLPAMSLFEKAARGFRSRFFEWMQVHAIANFSNLRWVISAGRFTAPAAVFFYQPRKPGEKPTDAESIRTYSPLIANQEATRSVVEGKRNESWSIVVNASEIKDIPLSSVLDGDGLAWKLSAWGSELDRKLLRTLSNRFQTIGGLEREDVLVIAQGPDLRKSHVTEGDKRTFLEREVRGKATIEEKWLRGLRGFFAFPDCALQENDKNYIELKGGREKKLSVCRPPHIVVSAARKFAIYTEEYIIVPSRTIGIVSLSDDRELLKALALFLNSDFVFYHQFFASTEFGVGRDRSTLKALRRIPTPLAEIGGNEIGKWTRLHDRLVKATRGAYQKAGLWGNGGAQPVMPPGPVVSKDMIGELNGLVYGALGLAPEEQSLIHDLVQVRLALNDGRLGKDAVRLPTKKELQAYGRRLKKELDAFVDGEIPKRHQVDIIYDDYSGMIRVNLAKNVKVKRQVPVVQAGAPEAAALKKCRGQLRQERSQWVYFDRNFRAYKGTYTYVLKPMQRFHWTETQARIDAREIITESMAKGV